MVASFLSSTHHRVNSGKDEARGFHTRTRKENFVLCFVREEKGDRVVQATTFDAKYLHSW